MGKINVVGIGPGNVENRTLLANQAMEEADLIVGYTVYVDLVREQYPQKEIYTTPMTGEVQRCQYAIDQARRRKKVAVVCSGDSGIYGMAALLYELRGEDSQLDIQVVPGLTAASSGGALLGAPLTHDFAVISLSDRLTPWELIEKRLEYAAMADLSIVLYNPVSKGRPDHLRRACRLLKNHLPKDRPCGVASQIGRAGEQAWTLTLEQLEDAPVDMFCTVFIGNSQTRIIGGKLVTPRGYPHG